MRYLATLIFLLALLGPLSRASLAADDHRLPLNVLYLARENADERTTSFVEFLSARFERCVSVKREDYQPELLDGIDVVLLDWSQSERHSRDYPSPIGKLEDMHKPVVLLGSAGHVIAGPWYVIGGSG